MESLTLLLTSFPEWGKSLTDEQRIDTLSLYSKLLEDIDGAVLKQSALAIASSSKFFPKIAEIREMASSLTESYLPTPLEAWGMVQRGDKSCCLANNIYRSLRFTYAGDPQYDYVERTNMNVFLKEYALQIERKRINDCIPQSVHDFSEALEDAKSKKLQIEQK